MTFQMILTLRPHATSLNVIINFLSLTISNTTEREN